ncbi:HAD-IA family hydrolase [Pseudonocardia sp. ICBG1293]|uniref:HAD-IA family hydrolase n=1 Tax=Pseudonocardia sp. ICBG1293 TaxID=2844382 RepID=UPI001CD008D8|nr:HAD-IA family hydrolase [Pseudonocardia sp. ICBG1293]
MTGSRTLRGLIVDYGGVLDDPADGALLLGYARRAAAAGVRTALFSGAHAVPDDVAAAFGTVLLGAVRGARKPSPDAFAAAAAELGLPAADCVVVDDLGACVRGAAAAGAVGVHHTVAGPTLAELEVLLGVPAREPGPRGP